MSDLEKEASPVLLVTNLYALNQKMYFKKEGNKLKKLFQTFALAVRLDTGLIPKSNQFTC